MNTRNVFQRVEGLVPGPTKAYLGESNFSPSGVVEFAIYVYCAVSLICDVVLGIRAEKVTVHSIIHLAAGDCAMYAHKKPENQWNDAEHSSVALHTPD